ncbi:MAG: hypothetical protein KDC48_08580 [Planctomycetes bacterium]|nr:hypothetical protein [Planctomycetota bacterium]
MIAAFAALLGALLTPAPQTPAEAPAEPPTAEQLLARLAKLPADTQALVVRNMERRLQRADDDLLQSILTMERGLGSYPAVAAPAWFATKDYAPVATPRQLVAADSPQHRAATRGMRELEFLPDLNAAVVFDWQQGKAAKVGGELSDTKRFANYVHGYAPSADHAVARILEMFDDDPRQRRLGDYFSHLYCDRDGHVFAGVSLFAAWSSGQQIEMPDTDGIAFAQRVLQTRSFTAPLPADRRRDRLYEQIRAAFAEHREYVSLRQCLAATYVCADPKVEATYQPLVRRGHFLWHQCGRDPEALARRLAEAGDRTELLRQVDAAIASQVEVADSVRAELADLQRYLRLVADYELGRAGG